MALPVSQAVKTAYANPSSAKTLVIYFPELDFTVDPETIHSESFSLSEVIMDMDSIEFVGCNPSKMQVQIQNFGAEVKDRKIQVSVYTEGTEEEPVPLFTGIVDAVTQQSNKQIKEIVAYDILYTKGNTNIASWYIDQFTNEWEDGVTLKDFRDALFTYLDIDVEEATLANDDLFFEKQYSPVSMKALDIIKYICQINGVFGIVNRSGKFEYRTLVPIESATVIPVAYYKEIDYQEFSVHPVDKLTIRQSDMEPGISVGSGTNNYIVQGNFFTFNLELDALEVIAGNLYPVIEGISYVPCKVTQVAYPWVECGDIVEYDVYDFEQSASQGQDVYKKMQFYVFERYIKGIQAFRDTYEAQGEQDQIIFITNINAQIQTIKEQIESIQGKMQNIELKYLLFYNETARDVADGQTGVIANIRFGVSKRCQVYFEMEYLIECETTETETAQLITNEDLVVKVMYEYDGTFIDSREPEETFVDGKHILHCFYVIDVDPTTLHTWKIWLNCSGGSVHIDILKAQNMLLGLNLIGQAGWDGTITVSDTTGPIPIHNILRRATADNVLISLINPTRISKTETLDIDIATVDVAQMSETLTFDEIMTNAYVDESTAAEMTFDTDYVEISNHNFVERQEWTVLGQTQQIDDGYCTKVTPFITDVTIDSVEVLL